MVDRRNMSVEDLIRSQLQSDEETPSFDLPFGTVMTKLKLFHVVEREMYHARQTFEINCHL